MPAVETIAKPLADVAAEFRLQSEFLPAGDQPQAIVELVQGLREGERDQVLLGVTGSGKTFTIAHTIAKLQRRPSCWRRTRRSPPSSMAR